MVQPPPLRTPRFQGWERQESRCQQRDSGRGREAAPFPGYAFPTCSTRGPRQEAQAPHANPAPRGQQGQGRGQQLPSPGGPSWERGGAGRAALHRGYTGDAPRSRGGWGRRSCGERGIAGGVRTGAGNKQRWVWSYLLQVECSPKKGEKHPFNNFSKTTDSSSTRTNPPPFPHNHIPKVWGQPAGMPSPGEEGHTRQELPAQLQRGNLHCHLLLGMNLVGARGALGKSPHGNTVE